MYRVAHKQGRIMGIGGPGADRPVGAPLRVREAHELNRLGVQGRLSTPLTPPEAKILIY